jgi:L-asparaginase
MTRGRRGQTPEIQIRLLREGIVESIHHAHAVLCDDRGRIMLSAGDPEHESFIRSAFKPFQAICVTSSGTMERLNLTDRDLAIICSSHKGHIDQTRQVFNILWRADIDPSALQCPIPDGKTSALQYNCSGKHAGMLAAAKQLSLPTNTYLQRNHPVQQLILNKLADLLKIPPAEFIIARDDCGAPTYLMQLRQMAVLYAQLASGESLDLERIVRAMTQHPDLVAGPGEFDTEVMRLTQGEIVSKSGAEGIQCLGRVREGMGLAIKIVDGANRAKYATAIHLMEQMGWLSPAAVEQLTDRFVAIGNYKRLEVQGELTMS